MAATSFRAYLASDAFAGFKRTAETSLILMPGYDWPETLWQRLSIAADELDTKARLIRWIRERWPRNSFVALAIAPLLWANYLEWLDAQPRLTHQQVRELAGAEIRRAFVAA
jgi:hypothetical protein